MANIELTANIIKTDGNQQLVWGWASVISKDGTTVVDSQGDIISPETLVKASTDFMLSLRTAKAMHSGSKIGEFVHSLPLTNDIAKALGISSNQEGWIVACKIHDQNVWKRIQSGELTAFSIGGKAKRRPTKNPNC